MTGRDTESGRPGSRGRAEALPRALGLLLPLAGAGCGLLFPGNPSPSPSDSPPPIGREFPTAAASDSLPPAGFGTLLQEEVSIALRRGELQLLVTPLAEEIIRATAPDTYERLSALARGYQEIFLDRTGSAVPFELFLVSLYTEGTEVGFEPEALNLVNRGLRYRPVEIRALTPDWESRRLRPRQAAMAVYAFSFEIDLERPTEVEYQEVRSREWERILPIVERERARLRTRTPEPN